MEPCSKEYKNIKSLADYKAKIKTSVPKNCLAGYVKHIFTK